MSHITICDIFNYVINYVLMSDVMATIFMTNSIVELIRNMFWPLFAETPCKIGAAIAPNRKLSMSVWQYTVHIGNCHTGYNHYTFTLYKRTHTIAVHVYTMQGYY